MTANDNGHEVPTVGSRERMPDEEEAEPQSPEVNALRVSDEDSVPRSAINHDVRGNYYEGISGGDDARYINGTYNDLRPAASDGATSEISRWQVSVICLAIALVTVIVWWILHVFKT